MVLHFAAGTFSFPIALSVTVSIAISFPHAWA